MSDRLIPVPEDLLRHLYDASACRFDHHGDCQSHGYSLREGEMCPQWRVGSLLAAGRSVPAREPAEERRAEYHRLLAEYHRLGDWLMEHPLEAAFMPDLLKPIDPDAGSVGSGG